MTKAAAASVALVMLIAAFCYWATVILAPKPQPQPIQVTMARLVQLTPRSEERRVGKECVP